MIAMVLAMMAGACQRSAKDGTTATTGEVTQLAVADPTTTAVAEPGARCIERILAGEKACILLFDSGILESTEKPKSPTH